MDDSAAAALSTTSSTLRRRNSIGTSVVLSKQLSLPATPRQRSSFHAPSNDITHAPPPLSLLNLELVTLKSSSFAAYTSLKELLPSSPSPSLCGSGISIRNRLVKQAAWAYLQPNSASPTSPSGPRFLRHLWPRRGNPLTSCLNFFYHRLIPGITRILDRILRALRGHLTS